MTIANEIQRIKTNIENAYIVCSSKGATIPSVQNSNNLATCINSIISGGGEPSSGYIPREVKNGIYQQPSESFTFSLPDNATDLGYKVLYYAFNEFSSLTSVDLSSLTTISGSYALYYAFNNCSSLASVDLSSLVTVSGKGALYQAFNSCPSLASVDLSSLVTVSGNEALYFAFDGCTELTSVDLSSLTTISGTSALADAFNSCSSLASVDLSSLTTINAGNALSYAFDGCLMLTSLSFPSLTSSSFGSYTNQFSGMLTDVSDCIVHFPENLQSVIGNWASVVSGFGGFNTTVLFDLPATT